MKKFLFSLVCYGFSSDEIKDRNAYYLGCKAYPPGHYKACQTGNQHIYQQAACKAFGLCHW
ncbi:hypothetical protein OUP81_001907 [Campylobacter upsaliensis]|uniref:Uncharacterized protein n=1 Tax=Campylobacter upsaliensis TaxID=28080 RepID=A0A5L8PFR9_CAMUP|nr:hypothetical protein [Campylobacter upsaliensis]EAI8783828.1 hypothetical protein [Campylobacter upsaliensis]EAJ5118950.1 hypothetical protein [Campylobacter upsaliensis]EAJ5119607.1 hypothetical protein [Campylobacter upsaliensis]EAJ7402117.1 hypothetical protein [Campylobacter upsaliensis]